MRTPLDQYPTPGWQTFALMRRVNISGLVCEPCCGDYAIINAMAMKNPGSGTRAFVSNDIDMKYTRAHQHFDASKPMLWETAMMHPEWTVTNPPFNVALDILELAYKHSRVGVAFLLRLSFMEPTEDRMHLGVLQRGRQDWLVANPPQKMIVLPRWRYNGRGTDSVTTAWFVWDKTHVGRWTKPIEIVPKSEISLP